MTLYTDQKPRVWSKIDNPPNGIIRVTFGDVTLSLSLTAASWLAENIQREIRTVEREHPEACGLTDAVRSNLKRGDIVRVRDDQGIEADYTVRQEPWVLGSGHAVVGLEGICGGYALDRVVKIVRFAEGPDR
jgi:hypothetical protein